LGFHRKKRWQYLISYEKLAKYEKYVINYKMKFRRRYEKSFVKEKITFRLVMDIDDIIFSTINY
jgi:hypothetical protein